MEVGKDSNNCILIGHISSNGNFGVYIKQNGNNTGLIISEENVIVTNVETEIKYSLINGLHTITTNETTLSANNSSITAMNYIRVFITNNLLKELKIHEL